MVSPLLPLHLLDPVPLVKAVGVGLTDAGEIFVYCCTYAVFYFSLFALPIALPVTDAALKKHAKVLRDQKIARRILRKGTGDWPDGHEGSGWTKVTDKKGNSFAEFCDKCNQEMEDTKSLLISDTSFEWKSRVVAWVNSVLVCWIYCDYTLRDQDWEFRNCEATPNPYNVWIHKLILGYFLFDWVSYSVYELSYKGAVSIDNQIHHIVSVATYINNLMVPVAINIVCGATLISEITNPLLHGTFNLGEQGFTQDTHSWVFGMRLVWAIMFTIMRFVFGTYQTYMTVFGCGIPYTHLAVPCSVGLLLISAFWEYKIIQGVKKAFGPKKEKPT